MTESTVQQLIRVPLCRGLTEDEAEVLLQISETRAIPKGETVFEEGAEGDGVYILMEGEVDILKQDKEGQPRLLATLSSGSVVGEMSLIDGNAPRSATVVARGDVRLLRISNARFAELVQRNDLAALKLVLNMARVMSERIHKMSDKVVTLLEQGRRREELADFQKVLSDWSF